MSVPVLAGLCRAGDAAAMAAAVAPMALLMRHAGLHQPWGETVVVFGIAIAAARLVLERRALYGLGAMLDPLRQASEIAGAALAGALAAATSLLLLHGGSAGLGGLLAQPLAWLPPAAMGMLALRAAAGWRLQAYARAGRLATKVAVIGVNPSSLEFLRRAADDPSTEVIGVYDDGVACLPLVAAGVRFRGSIDDFVAYAQYFPVDAVVIALPPAAAERIADVRSRLAGIAADLFLLPDLAELPFPGAAFACLGDSPVIGLASNPIKDWAAVRKAVFDRVAAAFLLVCALPLMLAIAVLIKLDGPGPVLFRQTREGRNGASFTMFKFRTMIARRPRDEWLQATRSDKRVTRVGRWLRRFSLDELPQLLNVLRGDMSLVGPRPHLASTRAGDRLLRDIVPGYQARLRMKPGITGWAQVHGLRGETRTAQQVVDRVAHDLYYIENWSLLLDLRIIVGTLVREVFSRSGNAY